MEFVTNPRNTSIYPKTVYVIVYSKKSKTKFEQKLIWRYQQTIYSIINQYKKECIDPVGMYDIIGYYIEPELCGE